MAARTWLASERPGVLLVLATARLLQAKVPTTAKDTSMIIDTMKRADLMPTLPTGRRPDGRPTFELVTVNGELRCRWRRVGDHDVFTGP